MHTLQAITLSMTLFSLSLTSFSAFNNEVIPYTSPKYTKAIKEEYTHHILVAFEDQNDDDVTDLIALAKNT